MKTFQIKYPEKVLSTILWVVAAHSIIMGLALITQPAFLMEWSGFKSGYERFFPAQGGVFHLLMAVAYSLGAANSRKYHFLIVFSVMVKAAATIFLLVYCFAVEFKWIILISGVSDGVMGAAIYIALRRYVYFKPINGRI
jgi:hypothetical protein